MARRKGIVHTLVQAQHAAEKQRTAQLRTQTQLARAAVQAQKAYERAQVADQKERARLYAELRNAQVALQNEQLEQKVTRLGSLLTDTLSVDDFFDLETLKQTPAIPAFLPGVLGVPEAPPVLQTYLPPGLSAIRKLLPGAKAKHAKEVAAAREHYEHSRAAHAEREAARQTQLATAHAAHEQHVAELREKTAAQHAEIARLQRDFAAGAPDAVVTYFTLVLESSTYPDDFPQHAKVAYVPESKQLVIEYDLPPFEIVPEVGTYKYAKTKDEITETMRPATQRKALYASVVAQVTLRTLHELFEADRTQHAETIVFNGYVDTIDKGTGRPARICLVTVRTTRDAFTQLDLSRVDPASCLKVLNAALSKSPAELAHQTWRSPSTRQRDCSIATTLSTHLHDLTRDRDAGRRGAGVKCRRCDPRPGMRRSAGA